MRERKMGGEQGRGRREGGEEKRGTKEGERQMDEGRGTERKMRGEQGRGTTGRRGRGGDKRDEGGRG